jgi:hypothetical protein
MKKKKGGESKTVKHEAGVGLRHPEKLTPTQERSLAGSALSRARRDKPKPPSGRGKSPRGGKRK